MRRLLIAALLFVAPAWAAEPSVPVVAAAPVMTVSGAWVRAMPPVAKNSAGYLVVENRGSADDVLLGARVARVRVTELHEMVRRGETLAMRRRKDIPVPAHGALTLAPGGLHLMLIDLQQPLQAGGKVAGVLLFRDAGEVAVEFDVRGQ